MTEPGTMPVGRNAGQRQDSPFFEHDPAPCGYCGADTRRAENPFQVWQHQDGTRFCTRWEYELWLRGERGSPLIEASDA